MFFDSRLRAKGATKIEGSSIGEGFASQAIGGRKEFGVGVVNDKVESVIENR